jgi:uncharacterized short protein YbdD (DUF466 family)
MAFNPSQYGQFLDQFFRLAVYRSEYEQFLEQKRVQHPDWEHGQREGLDLLWNKKVDPAELQSYREASERKKPYPYDVNF